MWHWPGWRAPITRLRTMRPDVDVLILGGGCAGLSLGSRLADRAGQGCRLAQRPSDNRQVLILEERPDYSNDRTWCFWRFAPHRFEHLVSHAWSKMTIGAKGRTLPIDCTETPYQMIEALPFYHAAQDAIARSSAVELALGTNVLGEPQKIATGWLVQTSRGTVSASVIVDTRPPRPRQPSDATLWQSFYGQEIIFDQPVFDPPVAGLMDFAAARTDDVLFHYILPFTPQRALVETTVFGPTPAVTGLLSAQQAAVDRLARGAPFRVVRAESGVLPMGMTAQFPSHGPGHSRAGLMSGAARPSTGYAFQRIQKWADDAAAAIENGGSPSGHQNDPALCKAMDRLFLSVVRGHPDRAPDLFMRMFGGTDPARIIRFLSDRGSLVDCMAIGATLPLSLFLGEMFKSMVGMPVRIPQRI